MANVELDGVTRIYPGGIRAVDGIDLAIRDGEFLAVVGPSGSGKTSMLRLIAGLEPLDAGTIRIGGRRADSLAPWHRDVALVFQDSALYPHLSAFENLAFGLRARRLPRAEIDERVGSMASLLDLNGCLDRDPAQLSGGQRRRVALGRALVRRPALLLLDEPFSALDAPMRASARADLAALHRRLGTTTLLVTHDQAEALALGDRVAVLDRGRLVQVDAPAEVYGRPATRFVAEFIGSPPASILPALIEVEGDALRLRIERTDLEVGLALAPWSAPLAARGSGRVDLGLRPEHVSMLDEPSRATDRSLDRPEIETTIERVEPLGHETLATLAVGMRRIRTRIGADRTLRVGDGLRVRLDLPRALWFDPASGAILKP